MNVEKQMAQALKIVMWPEHAIYSESQEAYSVKCIKNYDLKQGF